MLTLWNAMNDLMNDELYRPVFRHDVPNEVRAAVDIKETDNAYVIAADMPGVKANDVDVNLDGRVLTVKGERKTESSNKDEHSKYHRVERCYSSFRRSFTLPDTADPTSIEAALSDGVLTVTVAKKPDVTPRKIEVKDSPTLAS